MRPAVPATLRLFARAYAWLLLAYPAPFRAEFGDEMALVFSDCCRAAWRAGGPRGVWRLMGRTVLDMLASAPPLWAERLEEAMRGNLVRRGMGLWLADHGLAAGGLALVVLGAMAWPIALPLGWTALVLAFFAGVAEADGIALPRPGRAVIRTQAAGRPPWHSVSGTGTGRCSSPAMRSPIMVGGRTPTPCASGRTAATWIRGGSFLSPPGADGRCVAGPRSRPCASSSTGGSAMSRVGLSSGRSPAPRCEQGLGTSQSAGRRAPIAVYARYSMAVLLTNASIVPSGDHDGTLIVPCPP